MVRAHPIIWRRLVEQRAILSWERRNSATSWSLDSNHNCPRSPARWATLKILDFANLYNHVSHFLKIKLLSLCLNMHHILFCFSRECWLIPLTERKTVQFWCGSWCVRQPTISLRAQGGLWNPELGSRCFLKLWDGHGPLSLVSPLWWRGSGALCS